jgi:hypothetical protein
MLRITLLASCALGAGCAARGASGTPPLVGADAAQIAAAAGSSSVQEGSAASSAGAWKVAPALAAVALVGPEAPFVSNGHTRGRWATAWRATDPAAFASSSPRPRGFVVCSAHVPPSESGAGERLLLCMRKESATSGDWSYAVGDDYGRPFQRVGKLADCAACHAVGPREGLYPAP